MADEPIKITVIGIDKIVNALDKFPRKIASYMGQAGDESAKKVIFPIEGVKKYPPKGPWNTPPVPYYIRGRGTQTKSGNRGNSERFGTKWYAKRDGFSTEIGNVASYAQYLASEPGEGRVYWATSHGWQPLLTTVKRNLKRITEVYQRWTDKLIKDLGL